MAPDPQHILTLLERTLIDADPTGGLHALTSLRAQLDELERTLVGRALREGQTFTAIAKPLGISRQAAHRRYRDLNLPAQPRLSREAREALLRARQEATRHGSRSIDSEHLLLALAPRGLNVEAARRSFGPPTVNATAPAGLHPDAARAARPHRGPARARSPAARRARRSRGAGAAAALRLTQGRAAC